MKKIILFALMLVAMLATAGIAYAATINGTNGHDIDWDIDRYNGGQLPPSCTPTDKTPCKTDLMGTTGADVFPASPGWDWIQANTGADVAHGGDGMDQHYMNEGQDESYGDESHDHLFGGDGADYLDARDGVNEVDNVEEVNGNQRKKDEQGNDTCKIDADPADGAVVRQCHVLVITALDNGQNGATPLGYTVDQAKAGDFYNSGLTPGTYSDVGFIDPNVCSRNGAGELEGDCHIH